MDHGTIDAVLRRAEAALADDLLPVEIFNDEAVFRAEIDRIFTRTWVFVAHESEIPNPGDYVLRRIGLDPVIVTRDRHGAIHVLSNYCRHRGTELCQTDRGHAFRFRCRYHGWTFRNDGAWIGAPQLGNAYGGLDRDAWGLLKAPRVESFCGLIFASLAEDGPTLREHLGGAAWALEILLDLHPDGMRVVAPPDRARFDTDWKIPADNFAGDAYHLYSAHWSVEQIGLAWGLERSCEVIETYEFENGHNFGGHAFADRVHPDMIFWGYPPSIHERFDLSRFDALQQKIARNAPPSIGTVFPNLSFIRIVGQTAKGERPTVYTSMRQWQPVAPGRIEFWNWYLVWTFEDAAEAARSYDVGRFSASTAGVFDQDDSAVWQGPARAAASPWLRKAGVQFHLQQGRGGKLDQAADATWTGPGVHRSHSYGEQQQLSFYREWLKQMQAGA